MMDYGGQLVDMHARIRRMFDEAKAISKQPAYEGPFIYGFTLRFTSDGGPVIEEFGNVSPYGVSGILEPVTDVVEKVDSVSVIVELPGVKGGDIDLRAGVESVFISVDTPYRRYLKDVKLSCRVHPESAAAKYNNGVLEVTLKRAEEEPVGRRIRIQ
jgi:HSP20 family protein